jgi:uncharacterized protein (DUF427 family)
MWTLTSWWTSSTSSACAAVPHGATGCASATSIGRELHACSRMTPWKGWPAPCASTGARWMRGPRSPYARVDALRSTRTVRIELDGVVLAESASPVMVFETGLPTRYYLDRTAVHFEHLEPADTVTACPYKGRTSAYWSIRVGGQLYPDLAWAYDFPTRQLLPIAGMVAFYNEKVDVILDGELVERPTTHFFR